MTITEISLVTIAGSLFILVLFLIGLLVCVQRTISLIKRDFHSLAVKGKSTIHGIKNLTTGSLNFLAQASGKGGKRSKKDEKVMNWLSIGMGLYSLASKYFGKQKRGKKR
jgi:hypothetical protein